MDGKTIVIVTLEIPYPCNSGGRKYTWERIMVLRELGYKIVLFSFNDNDEYIDEVVYNEYFYKYKIYKRKHRFLKAIKHIGMPFSVASRMNENMKNDINELILKNEIDCVILDTVIMSKNLENRSIPCILTQHNIEYNTFKKIAINSSSIVKKLIFYREYLLMKRLEKKLYKDRLYQGMTFISKADMDYFKLKFGEISKLKHIPMGVKKDDSKDIKDSSNYFKGKIVFTGKMDYQPNIDAMKYFVENIFIKIKEEFDFAKLYIVGKNPVQEIKSMEKYEGVIVTGMVDSIEPYINDANIVVLPLLSGGGVKIKLFEALEYKRLIISTHIGIEGTNFVENEHYLLANNREEYINLIGRAITDYDEYKFIGNQGYSYMNSIYSWKNIGEKYKRFIEEIIN